MAQIKCIYGAPCSGKTTFVKENASADDIIWDYDHIRKALTNHEEHVSGTDAQEEITKQLRQSFAENAGSNAAEVAWFICTRASKKIRELLGKDAEYIEMGATEEECLKRLEKDDSRKDKELMKKLIHEYYEEKKSIEPTGEGRFEMGEHEREIRTIPCELRASRDDDHDLLHVDGEPIVFNKTTDIGGLFSEEIAPEAVSEKILQDVVFLVNHDMMGIPMARSRRNTKNSNLRFAIEKENVAMETDLDLKNPKVQELGSALDRHDVEGMSFAFVVEKDEWTELESSYPHRRITKFKDIYEVSAVTWPAYPQTSIASRSLESAEATLKEARSALESAKEKQKKIAELNQKLKEIKK